MLNPLLLSHLHTAGQSRREVGGNVGLWISKSYRNVCEEWVSEDI